MTLGARFTKWGLGLFIFGVFLVFGIIGHYCGGARWPTGEQFLKNITLWYACPWTLSVASVQAGGLGMVALGLAQLTTVRLAPAHPTKTGFAALWLCVIGLVGVFLVGYPGYFRRDLAELLLFANRCRKERLVVVASILHWGLFRWRGANVRYGATRPQRNSRYGLMSAFGL